jgi:hypothetical protein
MIAKQDFQPTSPPLRVHWRRHVSAKNPDFWILRTARTDRTLNRELEEIVHQFVTACIGVSGSYERSVEVEGKDISFQFLSKSWVYFNTNFQNDSIDSLSRRPSTSTHA